jgi:hypothetical protein
MVKATEEGTLSVCTPSGVNVVNRARKALEAATRLTALLTGKREGAASFTRYAIQDTTNGQVVVAIGGSFTRLAKPSPGDRMDSPLLWGEKEYAKGILDGRLHDPDNPNRYQVIPVTLTFGG